MVLTAGSGQVHVVPISDYQLLQSAFNAINQDEDAGGGTVNPSGGKDEVG